jgi:hypothetical protein
MSEPRAVVDEMCPNCEDWATFGHGFPHQECTMCDGTGHLPAKPQSRAVVDELCCENPNIDSFYDDSDQRQLYCRNCKSPFPPDEPHPRALVAISEDRQWYTVLAKEPSNYDGKRRFTIFRWSDFMGDYQWRDVIEDTGQDAHEVLAAWLEGRAG